MMRPGCAYVFWWGTPAGEEQGRAFVSQNNITGLQCVIRDLWNLLPEEIHDGVTMGYQAGIVKSG